MDVATLVMTAAVLEEAGVREAARRLERAPSTVSAAAARFAAEISVPLLNRTGASAVLTLEASRVRPDVLRAAGLAMAMIAPGEDARTAERRCAAVSIGFVALQRFALVSAIGSIRRAARQLGLGQPQLTQQIRRLEAEFGAPLLERSPRGIRPTAAGAGLLAALPALEAALGALSDRAADRFRTRAATVRLGSVMPLGHDSGVARILAGLVADWRSEHPRQPLFLTTGAAEALIAGLEDRRLDVVLLDSEAVPAGVRSRLLGRSPLALVGPRGRIDRGQTLEAMLSGATLALTSRTTGLRQRIDRHLADLLPPAAVRALSVVEVDSVPVIVGLVREFGHLTILPESAVDGADGRLEAVPLGAGVEMILHLAWGAGAAAARQAETIAGLIGRRHGAEPLARPPQGAGGVGTGKAGSDETV